MAELRSAGQSVALDRLRRLLSGNGDSLRRNRRTCRGRGNSCRNRNHRYHPMSLNKVLILGNLVRDPEVKFSTKGTAYAHITVASTTTYTLNGEKKEETAFVDVTVFGKMAEKIGASCRKGTQLFVEGRLKLDSWNDKKTGEKRSKLGVMAESCRLAQVGNGDSASKPSKPASAPPASEPSNDVP